MEPADPCTVLAAKQCRAEADCSYDKSSEACASKSRRDRRAAHGELTKARAHQAVQKVCTTARSADLWPPCCDRGCAAVPPRLLLHSWRGSPQLPAAGWAKSDRSWRWRADKGCTRAPVATPLSPPVLNAGACLPVVLATHLLQAPSASTSSRTNCAPTRSAGGFNERDTG